MVQPLFAVMRARGKAWEASRPLDEQADWRGHADFMDKLYAQGFVLLAGPLEGTEDALLIIRAADAEAVRRGLEGDPWNKGLLGPPRIMPWTLRLGRLG